MGETRRIREGEREEKTERGGEWEEDKARRRKWRGKRERRRKGEGADREEETWRRSKRGGERGGERKEDKERRIKIGGVDSQKGHLVDFSHNCFEYRLRLHSDTSLIRTGDALGSPCFLWLTGQE
jgi:hypothetical protein